MSAECPICGAAYITPPLPGSRRRARKLTRAAHLHAAQKAIETARNNERRPSASLLHHEACLSYNGWR